MGFEKFWILILVCLLACSAGFKKFIWFMSVGYGLAIACAGVTLLVMFIPSLSAVTIIQCAILVFYGLRLASFLLRREMKSAAYRRVLSSAGGTADVPLPVKVCMWLFMGVLYAIQVSPVFYRLYNGSTDTAVPLIGAAISLAGALIEMIADIQKSEQKKANPDRVAMEGLYKICRCPNYFGELLMWTGVTLGGFTAYHGIGQWLFAAIGFIAICVIMSDGAKRLEKRQMKRCGNDPEYIHYCDTTPIIIPGVPVYHLVRKEDVQ